MTNSTPRSALFARGGQGGNLRVKICGITRESDALVAINAGADALGFNFFPPSKRALDPEIALPWIRNVPSGPAKVAVVVNPSPQLLDELVSSGVFDAIQFHGDETPEFCATCPISWMKAIPCSEDWLENKTDQYCCFSLLLDAVAPTGGYGGTGLLADWTRAGKFIGEHPGKQVWLAGGLTPENVAAAIRATHPFGLDVAGGVESSPGNKDPLKIRAFVDAVRAEAQAGIHPA